MTNKVKLLTAFFVLSFAMMMGVTPFSIGGAGVLKAAAETGTGAFKVDVISGSNNDYSYANNVLTISGSGEYTISMDEGSDATSDVIKVTSTSGAKITLKNVNISSINNAPIEIASGAGKVTIKLVGENTLTPINMAYSGLAISTESEVTITSDFDDENSSYVGSLTVSNENVTGIELIKDGVAIGHYSSNTNINITGGIITAKVDGEYYGVAIGSYIGNANINITGGIITAEANGEIHGVGIGSYAGDATITIEGGTVKASADSDGYGVAIGGLYSIDHNYGYNNIIDITIKGGDITAEANSNYHGAAIGSYDAYATNITIEEGTVTAYADGDTQGIAIGNYSGNATINISGGEVTVEANGSEESTSSYGIGIGSYYSDATIKITGGTVTATADGDVHGLAIGSHSNTATITIEGGTVTAVAGNTGYGNNYGVAIGSDEGTANITISDGTVTATAMGDIHGLAIGSHSNTATINIDGGTVNATADGDTYGTAIGTDSGTATTITITGGTITAEAKEDSEGHAVKGDNVYIAPAEGTALNAKYVENGEDTLYVFKTDVTNKVGGTYFYSNYGGEVKYDNTNVSITKSEDGNYNYNVVVSEYGGDYDARYLESVIVLINAYETYAVENYEIKNYQEYTKTNENDSIVFPVTIDTVGNNEAICVLVKTYEHKDAENEKSSIIYYLSDALEGGTTA